MYLFHCMLGTHGGQNMMPGPLELELEECEPPCALWESTLQSAVSQPPPALEASFWAGWGCVVLCFGCWLDFWNRGSPCSSGVVLPPWCWVNSYRPSLPPMEWAFFFFFFFLSSFPNGSTIKHKHTVCVLCQPAVLLSGESSKSLQLSVLLQSAFCSLNFKILDALCPLYHVGINYQNISGTDLGSRERSMVDSKFVMLADFLLVWILAGSAKWRACERRGRSFLVWDQSGL